MVCDKREIELEQSFRKTIFKRLKYLQIKINLNNNNKSYLRLTWMLFYNDQTYPNKTKVDIMAFFIHSKFAQYCNRWYRRVQCQNALALGERSPNHLPTISLVKLHIFQIKRSLTLHQKKYHRKEHS